MQKVAVVILNWNGVALLEEFIPILLNNTPLDVEIIVGDNASTDHSMFFLEQNFPRVRRISNKKNLGYAGGYNSILEFVIAEYFVLLNSDVEVSMGWINPVIDYMDQHQEIAAAQPKILSYHDRQSFEYAGAGGGYMDKFGYFFCRGRLFDTLEKDQGQYNDPKNIFWASGAAFFIRSKLFRDFNGFDSSLFAHMEEIDLCWRLQKKGWKISYIPTSTVYHLGGGTLNAQSERKTYLNFRNNLLILDKNLESSIKIKTITLRFLLDFMAWLRFILLGKWKHSLAISRAHFDYFQMRKKLALEIDQGILTNQLDGYFCKSLVWNYYFLKRKRFSDLPFQARVANPKKASMAS